MNSKLKAWAGKNVIPHSVTGGCGGRRLDCLVHIGKANKGRKNDCIVGFSFHPRAIRELGWEAGNSIGMNIGSGGEIVLARVGKENMHLGRTLGGHKSKNSERKHLRFRVVPEFFEAISTGPGREVEVMNGTIAFYAD